VPESRRFVVKEIRTEIEINASAERVWQVLTDFPTFSEWNPFVRGVQGELRVGARLDVYLRTPDGRGMNFKPKILGIEPNREFRWLGRFLMPGIFDGEHFFRIEPLEENRVRFVQQENFRGLLVPLFALMGVLKNTRLGFEGMNRTLKARAEQASA